MPGVRGDQGPRVEPWQEKKSENFPGGFIFPPGISEIHRPAQRVDEPETSLKTQATHFFHNVEYIQQMVAGLPSAFYCRSVIGGHL